MNHVWREMQNVAGRDDANVAGNRETRASAFDDRHLFVWM